ncbi:hypothetical protein EMIHUDRAFT_117062 [Emiliania huxleyi CCMP1516]|uniref:PWWP domain-containing protein n=2 Tax=Emiliania huxleyi TaxID=2903 RepID=A0A0D3JDL4_EMIH1|nr:hypothetical protein EMIHUDRAFT_117062 [Emiliania huxleyi CCMP1516]EOD21599.1 hypothetical protein EMIHUDRAFT_117062 [Emiliania huxleyi CCMP1516]|eukprot:XP_005774028.1 hypothetical protein EMIHUDRAFT_117062 [Emiliania huxleyi CCMP1516]
MDDEDYVVAAAAGAAGTRGARRLRRDAVRHRAWRAERIGASGHRVAVRASATESGAEEDLARGTGCRPGMAMNDGNDLTDTDSHWHELPPLQMGDLCIAMEELLGDAGETGGARVVTEGDFEALCRMEVTFKRKKGEYFACYEFGGVEGRKPSRLKSEGVARRAAFHAREREARDREAAQGLAELPSDEAAGVKEVSARGVLESVAESGPNYVTLPAAERQKARRERLRVVEAARQAGQAIVDTGTHVEILGVQERWWPATIMGRQQDVDGRLVHEVEYDGYPGEQYWHVLDDEEWRVVTAPASDAADAAADAAGNAAPANGEESDSEESGDEAAPAALTRLGVQRSALADVLEDLEDELQEEATRGDDQPLLSPHGPNLSKALRYVRRRLREYLSDQAEKGKTVPMQQTSRGLHPTIRWTIRFGQWLATTRKYTSKASRWDFSGQNNGREQVAVVRTGRGEDSVYVAIQHMKNHVWREVWPAMPAVGSVEAKQYWRLATHHVMSLFDGGGGGMKRAAELAGRAAGQAAAHASAAMGKSAAQQRKASEKATKKATKHTMSTYTHIIAHSVAAPFHVRDAGVGADYHRVLHTHRSSSSNAENDSLCTLKPDFGLCRQQRALRCEI